MEDPVVTYCQCLLKTHRCFNAGASSGQETSFRGDFQVLDVTFPNFMITNLGDEVVKGMAPSRRFGASVAFVNNIMLVFGGSDSDGDHCFVHSYSSVR